MAVEIPVVIDILGGVDDAIKNQLPKAIKDMQVYLDKNALKFGFRTSENSPATTPIKKILESTTISAKELRSVLQDIDANLHKRGVSNIAGINIEKANRDVRSLVQIREAVIAKTSALTSAERLHNQELRKTAPAARVVAKEEQSVADGANKMANGLGRAASSASKTNAIMRQLTSYAASFVSVWSAVSFIKRIRETTAEFELQEVALGGILQDTAKAHSLFQQIKAAAVESPFFVKDLVTYTKQLSAYRIETDKLFDVTMQLADVSAGLGVDMNRLILAYGQVRAASVLRGQELRQFTEAGVPLVELLAEKFSELRGTMVSTADVFKLISERAVPFRMVEEIFNDMTSAGGMFYKMQEKQAETLAGRWNNLKDSIAIALDEVGRTEEMRDLFEAWISASKTLVGLVPRLIKPVRDLAVAFALYRAKNFLAKKANQAFVVSAKAVRRDMLKQIIANENLNISAARLYATMGAGKKVLFELKVAFQNLGRSAKALLATMAANPLGALITVGGAVLSLFHLISHETKQEVATTDEVIETTRRQKKDIDVLISSYNELSSKENLNERQSQKLKGVTEELAKIFRDKGVAIDENTGKLNLNREALEKLGKEEKDRQNDYLKDQKALEESYLRSNERRLKWIRYFQDHPEQYRLIEDVAKDSLGPIERIGWYNLSKYDWAQQFSEADWEELKEVADWIHGGDLLTAAVQVQGWIRSSEKAIKELDDEIAGVTTNVESRLNGWQRAVWILQESLSKSGSSFTMFQEDQLTNFSSMHDFLTQLAKDWEKQGEEIKTNENSIADMQKRLDAYKPFGYLENIRETSALFNSIQTVTSDNALIAATQDFYNRIFALFGVDPKELLKRAGGNTAYTQPAYISAMNEQLKFMKDFEKGYRDLEKYMGKANALSEEFANMSARGLALGIGEEDQKRAAEGLSDWYKDVLEKTAEEMRRKTGLRGSVQDLLSYQITGSSNRDKMIRDFQKLLQQIFDARTDFNTDKLKKNIEEALKDVNEKIKKSETARNFFNDILEATGDEKIALDAAVSVYGTPGKDFQDRIQEEMGAELERLSKIKTDSGKSIIDDSLYQDLMAAINTYDMDRIRELFELLPTAAQDAFKNVLDEEETFNRNWIKNFYDTYSKTKTFQERVDTLESRRTRKLMEAQKMGRSESDIKAINAYFDKQVAGVWLEDLKDKDAWTKTFEDLEGVSNETLNSIIALIDEYVEKYWSDLEPTQQKELIRARENAEAQKLERNAFKGVISAIEEIISATREKNALEDAGKEKTEDHAKAADRQAKALFKLKNALDQISSAYDNLASNAKDLMNVFASDEDASYYGQQLDNLSKTLSGVAATSVGIGKILTGTATPQDYLNTISGIADTITGIFGARNARRIRQADEQLESLSRTLDGLQKSYEDLEAAMSKTFGEDYLYNLQEEEKNLRAQREAYLAQAQAERSKGKKADEDKIRDYEDAAREASKQLDEMRGKAAEFFTGTDVASAATDFANSWIEAYKEFGSTTDAMKEKFQDMIQSMIEKSLAAKIMQSILQPLFDNIDEMARDGDLTASEISNIAGQTGHYIDLINAAMNGLMTELGAAGYNLRQQAAGATGIKRDIQGATEESINALTAGINTQNFYMSFVPTIGADVAAIREALTGESSVTRSSVNVSSSGFGDDVFRGQMSRIDENIMEIRALLKSVISPRGTTASTHSVSVKY